MDMYTPQSDLDVSINFGNGTSELPREKKLQILKRFTRKLRILEGEGHVRNVVSIVTAKVPIVKFCDQGTAVECDLSVENKDGILNSQIIRIVSQIDGRFQKLCMLVKHWAKAHEVNSALHRTLNSVSITLLVALHLQTQNPPILPPFSMLFKDGIDPLKVEKRTQNFLNWGQRNQESVAKLFATFFIKLQSVEFLWRQGLCVSVLNGLWISKKWKKVGAGFISVEDFTDVSQNAARRVNGLGAKKIYSSIDRTVEDIFEFLNDKVSGTDLRHKLFGQGPVVQHPPVAPLNGNIAGRYLKRRKLGEQAVVQPGPPVPTPLNGKIAGTHLKQKVCSQQAVVKFPPPVPSLNGNIAERHLKRKMFGQQAVVQPRPPVPPPNGNLRDRLFGQQAVLQPLPPMLPLNENMAGRLRRDRLFGQQAVMEPRPSVLPYNGNIAGTHLSDRLLGQQAVVEPRPSEVLPFNGNIAGTHLSDRFFGQHSVVEHPSPVPSLHVYPHEPQNNYRNGFSALHEIHYNKRVCMGNGNRAEEETGHRREEEGYDDLIEKRNRYIGYYNGLKEFNEAPLFGNHIKPLDDTYRRVPLNGEPNGHLVHHRHDDRYRGEEAVPVGQWHGDRYRGEEAMPVGQWHDDRYRGEEPMPVGQWHEYGVRTGPPLPEPPRPPLHGRVSHENFRPQNLHQPHFGRSFY
ncbi:uncharacterized protein LOC17887510 isoform X2 [Capsella rubella]|nr:uncharacterized protein LOC17887510 isoform X2 [Capsella rubella]